MVRVPNSASSSEALPWLSEEQAALKPQLSSAKTMNSKRDIFMRGFSLEARKLTQLR
jgi:hypothetical protein